MRRSFFVRFDWILDFGWVILTHEFPQKVKYLAISGMAILTEVLNTTNASLASCSETRVTACNNNELMTKISGWKPELSFSILFIATGKSATSDIHIKWISTLSILATLFSWWTSSMRWLVWLVRTARRAKKSCLARESPIKRILLFFRQLLVDHGWIQEFNYTIQSGKHSW